MINQNLVVTIDGPCGVGKSTVSKKIAQNLNWLLLESGNIYRFLAFLALNNNIPITEKNIILLLNNLDFLSIKKKTINFFNQTKHLEIISNVASQLGTYSDMKKMLIQQQRSFIYFKGLIAEGRDMGTVVFPDAVLKFFIDANLEVRAKRRALELKKKGYYVNNKELFIKMQNRDERDQNRLFSPLCAAKNAIILDSTYMTISEVVKFIIEKILKTITR